MIKQFTIFNKWLTAIVLLITLGIGQTWAATARFIWNATGNTMTSTSGTQGQIDLSTAKNSSGTNPAYTSNQLRLYYASNGDGGSVTVTAKTGYVITGVTINSTTNPTLGYKIGTGSYNSKSWASGGPTTYRAQLTSLSATSVTFRNQNTSSTDIRIHSLIVVYQPTSGGSSGNYKLIENAKDIESGEYLIVYNNNYALDTHGGNMNANTYGTGTDISSYYSSKTITSNSTTDALAFVIEATTNGYSIYKEIEGAYLGCNSTNTGALRWDHSFTASQNEWTLGVNSIVSYDKSTMGIRWNNTTSPKRFTTYTTSAQSPVQLFKRTPDEECQDLASLNGSVSSSTATSVTLQWDKIEGVDATTPYEVTCKAGGVAAGTVGDIDLSGTKATCEVTGLTACTEYTFTIFAYEDGSGDYCDDTYEDVVFTPGTHSVSVTPSHVSTEDVIPTTHCNGIILEYTPDAGYSLPSDITVTGASDYDWTDGIVTIEAEDVTGDVSITITGIQYTATFSTGTGNPTVESLKGGTVVFPAGVTPVADNWEFVGWATSKWDWQMKAPHLYMPGDSYELEDNTTFYAVYRKYTSGTATATFTASGSDFEEHEYYARCWVDKSAGVDMFINKGSYTASTRWNVAADDSDTEDYYVWINAHRKISTIVFTSISSHLLYDGGVWNDYDDAYNGSNASIATDGTTQTVTCTTSGNVAVTGVITYSDDDIEAQFSAVSVTYYKAAFASEPICDGYTFHTGNNGDAANLWTITPFVEGTSHAWNIANYTIPSTTHFYVGRDGYFMNGSGGNVLGTSSRSATKDWNDAPYHGSVWEGGIFLKPNNGTLNSFAVGRAAGATGTITIIDNSSDYNLYASFTPDGYGITYSGSGKAFTKTATANTWETDVVTLPAVSTTYNIGLKTATAGTYVKCAHSKSTDEAISAIGVTELSNGKKKILFQANQYANDGAKIGIYNVTASSWVGFMTDADEDGVYEAEVPTTCSTVIFSRHGNVATPAFDNAYSHSVDISLPTDGMRVVYAFDNDWDNKDGSGYHKGFSPTNVHPATEDIGKFRMWDNSTAQNWYVHFVPYYKLTYNANGGSNAPEAAYGNSEVTNNVTVSSGSGLTAPTGKGFEKWNTASDGSGEDVAAGTYTLTQDLEIFAIWTDIDYKVTVNQSPAVGATTTGQTTTAHYGGTINVSAEDPVGYEFHEWTSSDGITFEDASSASTSFTMPAKDVTVTANWSILSYNIAVASVDHVTITATPASESAIAENANRNVNYGKSVTLAYSSLESKHYWGGWKVTNAGGDDVTASVVVGNTLTVPAYTVTVSAIVYGDLVAWCEPNVTVSDGFCLTSYYIEGAASATNCVYTTSAAGNLLTINSTDLGGVDRIEFSYLDGDDNAVTLTSSSFRLCNDGSVNYNVADPGTATTSWTVSGLSNTCDLNYSVRYKPTAYNQMDNYKLKMVLKKGGSDVRKTIIRELNGRSLPEEFVIASKANDGLWYALPNTLKGTQAEQGAITPIRITVDEPSGTPTKATYAPTTTIYKGRAKYAAANRSSMALTSTGSNYLQTSTSVSQMWLSSSGDADDVDWYMKSSDRSVYTMAMDPVNSPSKKMGINGGNMGYYATPTSPSEKIYLLPVENKYTEIAATATEWGQKSVILDVDAQGIASAQARIGNGDAEAASSFGQTRTSVKNAASKYNYTVSFSSTDFSTHKGELLYIDWLDGSSDVVSTSAVTIPWIIATNSVMGEIDNVQAHWKDWEVHVLPGITLEADGNSFSAASNVAKIKTLEIYPGATVKVTSGTLNVTNLIMRNGWTRAGEKAYDAARLYIPSTGSLKATNVFADWYIDFDQYYPVSVPWKVATAGITYLNTSNSASGGVKLRYYDGEGRANGTNGSAADGANWLEYSPWPTTMEPGKGYAMTARRPTGKAFSIVRLPLTLPSGTWGEGSWTTNGEAGTIGAAPSDVHKDTVYVHAWGVDDESKPRYAVGWNFIANPYMSIYQGPITHSEGSSYNVEFVTIPDTEFKEYDQYPVGVAAGKGEKLLPASGFFIQTAKDGTLTFGTGNRQAAAPSFRNEVQNLTNKQKAYIVLNDEENEDMMGLLVSDLYTADYDINGDLEKLMGEANSLKTYMRYNEMNMAYVAINEELAREWIPITVRIPENGEYTYSLHEVSIADELEGVYLIDYQNGNVITNLLDNSYTFYSPSGIISGRFAINAIVGMHDTPTDVDIINAGGDIKSNQPFKFIYNDKVFILHNGVIYDSTGKKVRKIKK